MREVCDPTGQGRYRLIEGDCLAVLPTLAAGSVDAVVTDPPYNTTKLAMERQIPWADWWEMIRQLVRPPAPICVFTAQPFTTDLINSNRVNFRYELVWAKTMGLGFYNANVRPLHAHETICVFCQTWRGADNEKLSTFNPQFWYSEPYRRMRRFPRRADHYNSSTNPMNPSLSEDGRRYPLSWLLFSNGNNSSQHPTQKPLDLLTWLVLSYSNERETVLDSFMGSGTTGVACMQTGRRFIGIEIDPGYFDIAARRIEAAALQPPLLLPDAPPEPLEQG